MPAIAPGESPELDSLTISVVGTDSVESVPMVVVLVVSDAVTVAVLDPSVVAVDGTVDVVVVAGVALVGTSVSPCPLHRNTVRKIKKD